ncbi:response regulator [Mesorhizobium sp. RP14(2022)]|uniref:Response regulator n=1 Tax=Mesorhizobium liriopis TaxID=2953882 RepID=A0ABT1C6D0_9HYPH|nr:response regulator [Mesorhizobium liriopis]MCO6050382.1 response regulator [Mesorhizobium liriopis]
MPSTGLRGRRILVIEDEYMLADDLRRAFEEQGSTVVGPVGNVGDALRKIAIETEIDAAVLDLNLGGELAFSVADALVARGVPLVITTGYSERDIPERLAEIKRCEKPVDPDNIVKALAGTLV